ncbi:MAG TPA: right-handed parallel beta-helix repeat-containing protein [Armatimonadota bacterium]|nr:right-handed parallel beta-helix repeat-containing protein [Armatimonadota bacterium]
MLPRVACCAGRRWATATLPWTAALLCLGGVLPHAAPLAAPGDDAARAVVNPVLEPATLRTLGAYWIVRGDANRNARVTLQYRKRERGGWQSGPDLFRVEKGAHRPEGEQPRLEVPEGAWLFAGSLPMLQPGAGYELKLRLDDPDGGTAEARLSARTMAEPTAPAGLRTFHVVPGDGGGSGTKADPFRGLAAAQAHASPGTLFLLHRGTYQTPFRVERGGEPGRPVIWRGAGDGEAVLAGRAEGGRLPPRVIDASGAHDVWFEGLSVRDGEYGLVAHEASRIVIRRCRFSGVSNGIVATRNESDRVRGFFIADNVLEGRMAWPAAEGRRGASAEEERGIQLTGSGHVVCYNRVRSFKDGIDTFPSPTCAAIDIHNNEISEMADDGIELDFSQRNVRCFSNRLTNVFQGISLQPIYGGPVYVFRNVLHNVEIEPFKMHNSPSGVLALHNTVVKKDAPFLLWTPAPVRNCVFRNNLFIGTTGRAAFDCDPPMIDCDFDYDGFGGGPWPSFLKWNGARYRTLEEVRARAPVYHHAVEVDSAQVFASGLRPPSDTQGRQAPPDARLRPGTAAIDAGQALPGFNDGYAGRAPDVGAYELGSRLPQYGPRPERPRGSK